MILSNGFLATLYPCSFSFRKALSFVSNEMLHCYPPPTAGPGKFRYQQSSEKERPADISHNFLLMWLQWNRALNEKQVSSFPDTQLCAM